MIYSYRSQCTLAFAPFCAAVQIKTWRAGVTVRSRKAGKSTERESEREDVQEGGANAWKSQLLCAGGDTPMVYSEARHYRGSQMIALAVTTGWAVRLWPLLRARLRTHILCSKWKKVQHIIFQYPFWENFKRAFFFLWETQHASACSQSPPSLFRQAKADMPAGRWNKYDKHAICIQRMGLISWLVSSSSHYQRCYLWRSCQTCPWRYCAVIFILIELKSETIQNKAELPSAVEKM